MFINYLKTALRNCWKEKGYAFLNILGLSTGLACSILILLWVQDEINYDSFHAQGKQLYQVKEHQHYDGQEIFTTNATPGPLAEALEREFPEIAYATRLTWEVEELFSFGEESHKEKGRYGDANLFRIFSFPFAQGGPATVLDDPSSMVISESMAQKYFGDEDPIGKTFKVNNQRDYTVQGVFQNIPNNSSLHFDYILPIENYVKENQWIEDWGNNNVRTYVMLHENTTEEAVEAKIKDFVNKQFEGSVVELFLQPYEEVYLYSDFKNGKNTGGRIEYVRLFSIVAIFILLIACINFMNLATARSSKRAKEIGVRKVVGAHRQSLIMQFMSESFLMTLAALAFALIVVALFLSVFNNLTGKNIYIDFTDPILIFTLLGVALVTGLVAGSYPALFLSSLKAVNILKGTFKLSPRVAWARKGLVVFQFWLSIILIVSTLVVYEQIEYIRNKNLGYQRENILYVPIEGELSQHFEAFKNDLLNTPGVVQVTSADQEPISIGNSTSGGVDWDGKNPEENILFHTLQVNYDFIETIGIEMLEGRSFSRSFGTDTANIIINEAAAKAMQKENPIGERIRLWEREGVIIGITKDFHIKSVYTPIEPLVISLRPENTYYAFVKVSSEHLDATMRAIENIFQRHNTAYPFEFHFLDESYERMYKSETTIGKLANYFAFIAIFISCLGLFGLASFTAEQRTKEIGVRKVLGASVPNLVVLLTSDFTKLVLIAFLIAAPVAYSLMRTWLGNFAYHVEMSAGIFVLAGIAAILIAWLTVSYQSVRAALSNPVKSLRSE